MSVACKKSIDSIVAYKAASTIESVKRKYGFEEKDIIKLEGNENRMGCSPNVFPAIEKMVHEFSYYPDLYVTALREETAKRYQVGEDNLIFSNGSFELISLIADAYIEPEDEAISLTPTFNWYKNVTLVNGGKLIEIAVEDDQTVSVDKILDAINSKTKIIWICNPNNPTGTLIGKDDLERLMDNVPSNVLLVLDEAYLDFADVEDYVDTIQLTKELNNLIVLKTFSKGYGLASFRVGYGIADTSVIETLLKVKIPPNVNAVAQAAALAALKDDVFHQAVINNNRKSLDLYYQSFEELGFRYIRSNANFVFVQTGIDGNFLKQEFLKYGIMIRSGADFGYNDWLRISIGTYEENQKVIQVLKKIISEIKKDS